MDPSLNLERNIDGLVGVQLELERFNLYQLIKV